MGVIHLGRRKLISQKRQYTIATAKTLSGRNSVSFNTQVALESSMNISAIVEGEKAKHMVI